MLRTAAAALLTKKIGFQTVLRWANEKKTFRIDV